MPSDLYDQIESFAEQLDDLREQLMVKDAPDDVIRKLFDAAVLVHDAANLAQAK